MFHTLLKTHKMTGKYTPWMASIIKRYMKQGEYLKRKAVVSKYDNQHLALKKQRSRANDSISKKHILLNVTAEQRHTVRCSRGSSAGGAAVWKAEDTTSNSAQVNFSS